MPNCEHCNKPLVSIGTARKNGKSHSDWKTRKYHKKCYKEISQYYPVKGLNYYISSAKM